MRSSVVKHALNLCMVLGLILNIQKTERGSMGKKYYAQGKNDNLMHCLGIYKQKLGLYERMRDFS